MAVLMHHGDIKQLLFGDATDHSVREAREQGAPQLPMGNWIGKRIRVDPAHRDIQCIHEGVTQ
jgi:hypothetical protein